ncbi:hypothetical protein Taro_033434 [Colocasia esculenta]|uniref:Uncharacterized protein n=1 Tax=Colocasia esculenta TaxID=4460 RepID=A0A843VXW3_COLES|nr:hypothetical protein [Colocasia esculenta]
MASKSAALGLLFLNLLLYVVFTMVAGWAINYGIEETKKKGPDFSVFYRMAVWNLLCVSHMWHLAGFTVPVRMFPIIFPIGNMATGFLVIFSLIAGVVGIAASLTGIHCVTRWDVPHLSSAAAASLCGLQGDKLGLEATAPGNQTRRTPRTKQLYSIFQLGAHRALETLAIILAGTQLLCTGAVHSSLGSATSMRPSYTGSLRSC